MQVGYYLDPCHIPLSDTAPEALAYCVTPLYSKEMKLLFLPKKDKI